MAAADPSEVQHSIDPARMLEVLARLVDWHRQAGLRDAGFALELDITDYARLHALMNPGLNFPYALP